MLSSQVPGTGKTTIIAEICYQVALRGGRTLIASQANLAVDNALSRLNHNPVIRAVRKGKADSVSPEGEPFIETKVIGTWLTNTSSDCENRLVQKRETVKLFHQLLASSARFSDYLAVEETFEQEQQQLQDCRVSIELDYQAKVQSHELAVTTQQQIESLLAGLENLFTSASSVNWCEPVVIDLLTRLQPYRNEDTTLQNLTANVQTTRNLILELGLVHPELELLALAGWLYNNLPAKLAKVKIVLSYFRNVATAMAEAESSHQIFQHHSAKLTELEKNKQEILNFQKCLDFVENKVANLDSSVKIRSLEIFRELQTVSVIFADYVEAESIFYPTKKILQERRLAIDSDYQANIKSYKEAKDKERKTKFLKNDLDALLTKSPTVNWHKPEVINLLASLQQYINVDINVEDSAKRLEASVSVVNEIATEFGLNSPKHGLFGLAGWLQNVISAQLPLIRTSLSYANDAAIAMTDFNSATQTLIKNKNLITHLQEQSPKIVKERARLSEQLDKLKLRQSEIISAKNEIQEWSGTAYLKFHQVIQRCFEQEQNLTENLLQLLPRLIVMKIDNRKDIYLSWESSLRFGNTKLNYLINEHREGKEINKIAQSIDAMLEEAVILLNLDFRAFNDYVVTHPDNFIDYEVITSTLLQKIRILKDQTRETLREASKPPSFLDLGVEIFMGQSRKQSHQQRFELKFKKISKKCKEIVNSVQVKDIELISRQITEERIRGIVTSSEYFLNLTNAEINKEIQQIQSQLNELHNQEIQISQQISAAQNSTEKLRSEGKQKLNQISALLERLTELSIVPQSLRGLAAQNLKPSDINRISSQFSEQVNYYQSRLNKLEVLMPLVNPFTVLSNINSLITVDLDNCTELTKITYKQIQNSQNQLDEIDTQLQEHIQNLNTKRSQIKLEIAGLIHQLTRNFNGQTTGEADIDSQILVITEQVETSRREAETKLEKVIKLWEGIIRQLQCPPELQIFFNDCLQAPSSSLAKTPQLLDQVQIYENQISQIENLIPELNPFSVLSTIKNKVEIHLQQQQNLTDELFQERQKSQNQLDAIKTRLQQQVNQLQEERAWWQEYWAIIPDYLKPPVTPTGLFDLQLLRSVEAQFGTWKRELSIAEAYLNRYQNFLADWIVKLREPLEQDRNELKQIYLDNSNVVGITCSQSANRSFSEEFKSFDVVIIDEVSKCTPPELLIPALKAKKLVLVGDHRQLPPMLNAETLEEIAEELGSTREDLNYLEKSLFKIQFEGANESIKKMLTTQYRMHPIIMGAINQFYDNRLECGLFDADKQRAHHLGGELINEPHHLMWIKTPIEREFQEQLDGTSFVNEKEVEVMTKLCEQMERAWLPKIQQGHPRKEVGIITFYGRQLKLIEDQIKPQSFPSLHIRTGTVDRFQGMERQVIIVSMVRNNSQGNVGFAKKPERINVAFSRAQELLIIVGCHSLFTQQPGTVGSMYSNISNIVRLHGGFINVSDILC